MDVDVYEGVDNLEVLQHAKNYNAHLLDIVLAGSHDARVVIDFGAGLGTFATGCRSAGRKIICIEPDNGLRQSLNHLAFETYTTLDNVLPETADCIYTLNVLEHIDDDVGTLAQFYSRLRAGGKLIVYVPAFPLLYTTMDKKVGHRRRYTRPGLESLVLAAGFRVDNAEYVDSLGFLATLIFKFFGNKDGNVNKRALIFYDRYIFPASLGLDRITRSVFGKNIVVHAHKPNKPLTY